MEDNTAIKTNKFKNIIKIISLIVLMIGIYYFIPKLGSFKYTFSVLKDASWFWLTIAFLAAIASFFSAGFTQFAAGNSTGSLIEITLVQTAGSFINHFLPFSLGGVNLVSKYYLKKGRKQAEAIIMSILPIIFGIITTVITIAIISPITITNYIDHVHKTHLNIWELVGLGAILIIIVILTLVFKNKIKNLLREALLGLKSISDIKQLSYLISGSLAITITSTLVLYASVKAIHQPADLIAVFTLYVTSALVSNIAPTPGGLGATEAFLLVGLAATHLNLSQAAAVILIYRFFTFWLPILPGGLALHRVNKLKIVG